jgi:hypothetical protein
MPFLPRDHIAAVVHAVGKIHIHIAGRAKHDGIASPFAAVRVAGLVFLVICLGFDDAQLQPIPVEFAF